MPESAEVKLTTEYLNEKLSDKMVSSWDIIGGKYMDNPPKGYDNFVDNLPMLVESVDCKGKFIYFTLYNENSVFYVLHSLRMTGRWQNNKDKYTHWYIEYEDDHKIWFRNPRGFATLEFTDNKKVLDKYLNKLGPDILTNEFSMDVWKNMIGNHSKKNITSFLMNQSIISGIGNYIKAESLYEAKISPLRKVGTLNENEIEKLYGAIRVIPRVSYNNRGLSISDYADEDGNSGEYEKHLKVYGKKSATKTKTSDGRVTYWCKKTQI